MNEPEARATVGFMQQNYKMPYVFFECVDVATDKPTITPIRAPYVAQVMRPS